MTATLVLPRVGQRAQKWVGVLLAPSPISAAKMPLPTLGRIMSTDGTHGSDCGRTEELVEGSDSRHCRGGLRFGRSSVAYAAWRVIQPSEPSPNPHLLP